MVRQVATLCTAAAWIVCMSSSSFAAGGSRILLGANPYLSNGATALLYGDYSEGVRLTERGLESPPGWSDRSAALSNLCAGLAGNANYDEAITQCTSAIEINDDNWQAYNNRAIAHIGLGEINEAQQDINRGLKLNPDSSELLMVQQLVWNTPRPIAAP
jgi:tetratricopeptide (TPR) repeat protein